MKFYMDDQVKHKEVQSILFTLLFKTIWLFNCHKPQTYTSKSRVLLRKLLLAFEPVIRSTFLAKQTEHVHFFLTVFERCLYAIVDEKRLTLQTPTVQVSLVEMARKTWMEECGQLGVRTALDEA